MTIHPLPLPLPNPPDRDQFATVWVTINGAKFQLPFRPCTGDDVRYAGYVPDTETHYYDVYRRNFDPTVQGGDDFFIDSKTPFTPLAGMQFYTVPRRVTQ